MFKIHVVCEGPTDTVVLEAAIDAQTREDYILTQIQPEISLFGGDQGPLGGGWKGVRAWCGQVRDLGGIVASGRLDPIDVLIVHIDADVADEAEIDCSSSCPPASDTTDPLRTIMLDWMGEAAPPNKTVLCTPSKATEAWVLAALYPEDPRVVPCAPPSPDGCVECDEDPAATLLQLARRVNPRIVRGSSGRVRKVKAGYIARQKDITDNWQTVRQFCTEAERLWKELAPYMP